MTDSVSLSVVTVTFLSVIISIISLCISIRCIIKDENMQIKSVKYSSILSLITFSLSSFIQIIILTTMSSSNQNKYNLEIVVMFNIIIWSIAQISMYSLSTLRLYQFNLTILQIQSKTIFHIKLALSVFFSVFILHLIITIIAYFGVIEWLSYSIISSLIMCIISILALCQSSILIYMFITRLFVLFMLNAEKKNTANFNDEKDEMNITINADQASVLESIVKHTSLDVIAIISSQVFLISNINRSISLSNEKHYEIGYLVFAICLTLNCCINSICILLNFKFSHSWYKTVCCIGDRCCRCICKQYLMQKVKKEYQEQEIMKLEDDTTQHIVEYTQVHSNENALDVKII